MENIDRVSQAVAMPPGLGNQIRQRLGVTDTRPMRIAFLGGPGDVYGSFIRWRSGKHEDRVPVLAYSTQFYSLCSALGAEALVMVEQDLPAEAGDRQFRFTTVARRRAARGLAWHQAEHDYARRLVAAIRDWRPDIIIVGGDLKPWAYPRLARIGRVILTIHNAFWAMGRRPKGLRQRLHQVMLSRTLSVASGAVCTSAECARQLKALAGDIGPVEVEMPQILASQLAPMRKRNRARKLLFLGRIEVNKGVFDLLSAFEGLAQRFGDARLVMAGSGSADHALRSAAAAHPAADRIEVPGLLDGQGVHDALKQTDLLVCPTRSDFNEGLALVVMEAAAQGVPSVASSVVPAVELAKGACITFPADDLAALHAAIARLMDDDAAYQELVGATGAIRPAMLDRSAGWGGCLARVLAG